MRLIGLSGYAQTGKDTVARILIERHGFERRAFADVLRKALYELNPILGHCECGPTCPDVTRYRELIDELGYEDARKTEHGAEIRALLQRLGTDVGRNLIDSDVWVDAAMRDLGSIEIRGGGGRVIRRAIDARDSYVFTDVRFPNEARAIVDAGGEVWRVSRPGYGPVNDHPSETALDDWPWGMVINNVGDVNDLADLVARAVTP